MKRFIRYLYEYQQGQRMRNVGFVKVEQDEESTILHIHGKGLRLTGEKMLRTYIFYMAGKSCIGIWQTDIEHVNPAVNYCLTYTPRDTGSADNYPLIEGVILENDGKRRFAAVWDDMPVDVEHMEIWEEEPEQEPEPDIELDSEEIEEDQGEFKPKYTKITRQDIAKLPRCNWKLANNSFLMHGCFNYHHLILVEEEEERWLGVPGVYHERERKAAEAFGFPRFLRMDLDELSLREDERNEVDDFGYWCRKV